MQRGFRIEKVYPGQVFYAMHFDPFTKSFKSHMFVCIYSSDFDNTSGSGIEGLLITSKEKKDEDYVELDPSVESMLKCKSYVDSGAQYRFSKKDIQAVLGNLTCNAFMEVMVKRTQVTSKEHQQCLKALVNMKSYEVRYGE